MLILASASKARLELLKSVGISPDKIISTEINEKHKKDEEEKCPYEEFVEEQEETLKRNDKKQEIRS